MGFNKVCNSFTVIVICLFLIGAVFGQNATSNIKSRSLGRVHVPWLGLGPHCNGCPQHYCDDDPAIIQGYCCGCSRIYDNIPVRCPPVIDCPANSYRLCEDYEYMMYCCC